MTIQPSEFLPALVQPHQHADNHDANGVRFYPDESFFMKALVSRAHIVAYRRKVLFERVFALGTSGGSSGVVQRWHCETGVGCAQMEVTVVLGLDDRNIANDPYVSIAITKSGGSTQTREFHGGATVTAATDAPEEFIVQTWTLDVDAASVYTGEATYADNVRVIQILVNEVEVEFTEAWTPSAGSQVLDIRIGEQLDGVGDLLRGNGGLRFDWSKDDGASRTRTSATMINLIDNASATPPTAASPGVVFNTQYRNTISATTVPIKMAVYGSIGAGSGTVVLRDTAGNDAATVTINGAAGWYTATGALTVGTAQKYDLMFASDGANLLSVQSVSVYEDG